MSIINTTFYSEKYKNRPGIMFPQKEIQIPTLHVGILVLNPEASINFEWKKPINFRVDWEIYRVYSDLLLTTIGTEIGFLKKRV